MAQDDMVGSAGDLYSLPLDEFTAARNRLAASLADQGETEEADRVAKLRKPTVAAWALNRAARRHPALVEELLESHQDLRRAKSPDELHAASESRNAAVSRLEKAAVAELTADGRNPSSQARDRITTTLLAVATDPDAETDLKAGQLARELEPSGTGWADITLPASPKASPGDRAAAAAEKARAEAERLEKQAIAAEQSVESAKRALDEARKRSQTARTRADEAAREALRAEEAARQTSTKD